VPQVVDAVQVPVLAAGGIGDGRGFAAALALGAVGVQMGTAFLATEEAKVGQAYKKALVMSGDTDTRLIRKDRIAHRRITDDLRARVVEALRSGPGGQHAEISDISDALWNESASSTKVPHVMSAGQVAGLVREIVPARVIVERMVRDARNIFGPGNNRLGLIGKE
jgi:enoyl-[acyl-carrier protein] reductase II